MSSSFPECGTYLSDLDRMIRGLPAGFACWGHPHFRQPASNIEPRREELFSDEDSFVETSASRGGAFKTVYSGKASFGIAEGEKLPVHRATVTRCPADLSGIGSRYDARCPARCACVATSARESDRRTAWRPRESRERRKLLIFPAGK